MQCSRTYTTWCWSRPELKGCIICGKSNRKHHSKGICQPCGWKIKSEKERERKKTDALYLEHKRKQARDSARIRYKDPIHAEKGRLQCKKWESKNKEYRKKYRKEYYDKTREYHLSRSREYVFDGLYYKVLERDNYKCVHCHKKLVLGRLCNVHHLDKNKKNNTMENLVSVCTKCHQGYFHKEKYELMHLGVIGNGKH